MPPALIPMLAAAALTTVPVPMDQGPQDVVVMERIIPAGSETGWHVHDGIEICHIVSGEAQIRTATGTSRYKAGQTGVIPRGLAHDAVNAGDVPLVLAVTLLVDHGTPLRTVVPIPPAR